MWTNRSSRRRAHFYNFHTGLFFGKKKLNKKEDVQNEWYSPIFLLVQLTRPNFFSRSHLFSLESNKAVIVEKAQW